MTVARFDGAAAQRVADSEGVGPDTAIPATLLGIAASESDQKNLPSKRWAILRLGCCHGSHPTDLMLLAKTNDQWLEIAHMLKVLTAHIEKLAGVDPK